MEDHVGCPSCGSGGDEISKAVRGNVKTKKTLVPYETVVQYEKRFKLDFGKTVGRIGMGIMEKIEEQNK